MTAEEEALTLQAGEWLLELQSRDIDVERVLAWQSWMTADPRHKEAFDRLQRVQECIACIESPPLAYRPGSCGGSGKRPAIRTRRPSGE